MKDIDLYIYLPNGSNTNYNKCFHLSSQYIDQIAFMNRLQLLNESINYLQINKIYYIGGQYLLNKYYTDIFQIFKNFDQIILTSAINILPSIKYLKGSIKCIDICRLSLFQNKNKYLLKTNLAPQVSQIENIVYQCRKNNIQTRIVVPVDNNFNQNILTFMQMSKYLYSDIVFRKISNGKKQKNFIETKLNNFDNIFYDVRNNYNVLIKRYKDINVWIQEIYSSNDKNNQDYIVYHPNGLLLNNFRK